MTELGLGGLFLIGGILIMSIICEWFYSKAVIVGEGECIPEFRVWCLARRVRGTGNPPMGEFDGYEFFLKLPSYTWELDELDGRWCWHQRRLIHSSRWGWKLYLYPEPRLLP